jgi:hypothetical protein
MTWSIEAIIAFVTLLATCVPLGALLWRLHKRRSRRLEHRGRHLHSYPIAMPYTNIVLDVEEDMKLDAPQYYLPRADSFVVVQVMVRSTCLTPNVRVKLTKP